MFIQAVNLHMHFLGSRGRIGIQRSDGSWDCLLDIPEWDYHWSSWYQLAQPVQFNPGDMLYVECHWDNTAANQAPVVAGDSYLEIGDMVGDLALVYDWCFAQTTSARGRDRASSTLITSARPAIAASGKPPLTALP